MARDPSPVARPAPRDPQQELNHQPRVMYLETLQATCELVTEEQKVDAYQVQMELLEMDQGKLQEKVQRNRQWLGKPHEEKLLKEPTLESQQPNPEEHWLVSNIVG